MWKATTSGTVGFDLDSAREIGGVGVSYCAHGSAVSASITVRVRSGGSGGTIVATETLNVPSNVSTELVQRAFSAFMAAPVTGDYVEFVIPAWALPVHAFGFWAGPALTFTRYTIEYVYIDPSDIQTTATGTVSGNRARIARDCTIILQNVVESLSIGASSGSESTFEDLQDALGWCGGLPTILMRVDDIELASTLGDIEETMLMRLVNAPEIAHASGPKLRVPLRLTDQ
ncbi:MAG: hypothetical protein HYV17_08080 [Xanthomonadales bacterium]|nr:hypothetical protein [Xanthomonadales bacterium]